jgi:3,4-dihydroxy 2-butanone 4-phosphate synthase / GTP cyclohydrolase II
MTSLLASEDALDRTWARSRDRFAALCALVSGQPIVVNRADHPDGVLALLADRTSVEVMSFAVRHTSGFLCVVLPADRCDTLGLPPMWPTNASTSGPAFTVTVDAIDGVSTGISAADRARTVQLLAKPAATPAEFSRPGHVVVVAATGTATLADDLLDLAAAAHGAPAVLFGAIVSPADPVRMARPDELTDFAAKHMLCHLDLSASRRRP